MLFELLLHHIPVYLFFSSQFLSSIRSNTDKLALYINKQQDPMGGPQTLRILQAYWDRLQMAAKAGGYPPPPFFPRIPWGHPGQSFPPYGLQHGGGRCDPALGDGGGADGGGSGGTRREFPGVCGIFYWDDGLVASPRT